MNYDSGHHNLRATMDGLLEPYRRDESTRWDHEVEDLGQVLDLIDGPGGRSRPPPGPGAGI